MVPIAARKLLNRVKSRAERRRGPARKDQSAAPVGDAIAAYRRRDMLSFSIPAHAGGRGPAPEAAQWAGMDAIRSDVPMSHGVDTRNRAWGVQSTAQQLFAEALGAKETLFSTNGSSMSARVAMLTVAGPGETLVMARNGHKSSFSGLVLTGAMPAWVDPVFDSELQITHPISVASLEAALDHHPEARAAMAFTPSYYGTTADVEGLADACHRRDLPLVVDDAWGLDYALHGHPELPGSPLRQGADLVIGSVHKTLSGFQQTSVLSVGSDRIDTDKLGLRFELEESTSISSLLLSGIDGARRQFARDGGQLLQRGIDSAKLLRRRLAEELPELRLVGADEMRARPGVHDVDLTHVMIETTPIGLTGYQADDWMRDERQIDFELADHRRLMALVTYAHGEDEIDRLVSGLHDLVDAHRGRNGHWHPRVPDPPELRTEQAMVPRDAFFAEAETIRARKAIGRVGAELVTPYPPGIPVLAPGEVVTEQIVDYFQEITAAGAFVEGAVDQNLDHLRVVA